MLDLHYWPTPNGKKVTIQLEECGLEYNVVECNIGKGDQFTDEFLKINPNNRMPALVDHAPADGGEPISVFESGAIMLYLAEKTGQFMPSDPRGKVRGDPVGDVADGQSGAENGRVRSLPAGGRRGG